MTYKENSEYNVVLRFLGVVTDDPYSTELIYAATGAFHKKKGKLTITDLEVLKASVRGKHQKHLEKKE